MAASSPSANALLASSLLFPSSDSSCRSLRAATHVVQRRGTQQQRGRSVCRWRLLLLTPPIRLLQNDTLLGRTTWFPLRLLLLLLLLLLVIEWQERVHRRRRQERERMGMGMRMRRRVMRVKRVGVRWQCGGCCWRRQVALSHLAPLAGGDRQQTIKGGGWSSGSSRRGGG